MISEADLAKHLSDEQIATWTEQGRADGPRRAGVLSVSWTPRTSPTSRTCAGHGT